MVERSFHLRTRDDEPGERLVSSLRHYDERLKEGEVTGSTIDADAAASTDCGDEMVECLHLLERVWPRYRAADGQPPGLTRIGRFEIERLLGQGGFGIVYLARDPTLGRWVALKIPRMHALLRPEFLERFRREARAAGGLDHPHIVPVYEAGEADGVCYIAAAYCQGPTLSAWLKEQASGVPPRTAAQLVPVADAVAYATAAACCTGTSSRATCCSRRGLLPATTGTAAAVRTAVPMSCRLCPGWVTSASRRWWRKPRRNRERLRPRR